MEYDDDDDDEIYDCSDDYDIEESDDPDQLLEKVYTVLSEAEVRKFQEKDISDLSNLLSITESQSIFILCHYRWDVNKVHEDWFADEENVKNNVGLFELPIRKTGSRYITCRICFDKFPRDELSAASCRRHLYCHECWRGYIGASITSGLGCLTLRCPDTSCIASVDQNMVNAIASDEDKEKYSRYLLQSYIECSKKIKWCPSPGCDFLLKLDQGTSNYDVACKCTNVFCWNCNEEAHRPVICDTVAAWIQKNTSEAENVTWILANSKPCPRCKKPIEKNQGCMHMTCRLPCGYQFCWTCLGPWLKHDYDACNRYQVSKRKGLLDEEEIKRVNAKNAIGKYTHYYERWASNLKSMKKARADLQDMQINKLDEFLKMVKKLNGESIDTTDLEFLTQAWEQIVSCRRILAWTYAYGYYLPEDETAKKNFFEFVQGEAESGLERLHKCVEKDLEQIIALKDVCDRNRSFHEFRHQLVGLTRVTNKYFEDLVRALENGLEEVNGQMMKNDGVITDADYENWMCRQCTYQNNSSSSVCEMCSRAK